MADDPQRSGGRIRRAAGLRLRRALLLGLVLALVVTGSLAGARAVFGGGDGIRLTAYFDKTISVHEGSDLRVLGIRVGNVDGIHPEGERVKVTFSLDEGVRVPDKVQAVVVAPSVVSGRFIQLSPAYGGGPQLRDGGVIPQARTATPMEVDELLKSISDLAEALGPDGANKDGALEGLVDTGAENLKGNGREIGNTIQQLGGASRVLNGSSADLVASIKQLQKFTTMLKKNDGKVRTVSRQLSDVSTFLAQDKEALAAALRQLGTALGKVKGFVKSNRGKIKTNVDRLADLTQSMVDQRGSLAEGLDALPLAASNLGNAYNPGTRTIDGRADLNELSMGRGEQPDGGARPQSLPALPLPPVGSVYGSPAGGSEHGPGEDR
ncbi:MCE family protein [Streptomyces sp. N2-109]|uniref:MCE family protein n=1 Tax=Streptomyces gossypii TaxID=2883101 RepID=A0ABT2JWX2_9ACTN|nr:MCE family protein [Streptomyces gossypii]MCT2592402.1 MCE family protein [Streptomyces gossypii]